MIILDDETSTTEQSPLKSPSSPVTSRYDAGALPPYQPSPSSQAYSNNNTPIAQPSSPQHASVHTFSTREDRELRRRTLRRFLSAFLVAVLIVLVWTSIFESVSLTLLSKQPDVQEATNNQDTESAPSRDAFPRFSFPFIYWPRIDSTPISCPTVTVTLKPTPTVERMFSMAYPPPTRTAS